MKKGVVYLVGGGCGDAALITWKGLRLLRECDVVLYDDLTAERLLEETKEGCEQIYVGKRYGKPSVTQERIHTLLLEKARAGKTVVRLKGGDPFVFGRGGEEMQILQNAQIPCEVVPGVSSAVAVPAAAGIPVTHRKMARSFHVITGYGAEEDAAAFAERMGQLAKLEGTLLFLMGLHHLEQITEGLLRGGKAYDTPAAVVSQGLTPKQSVVRSSLGKLAERVREAALETPAVIVIGETASMDLRCPKKDLLQGVTVGVTGTERMTRKLRERLEAYGATVVTLAYTRIVPYAENPTLDAALLRMEGEGEGCRWAVFTSPHGVSVFFSYLQKKKIDVRRLSGVRFAVVGPGTAAALEERSIFPAYLPQRYDVAQLARGLCGVVRREEPIFLLRAEKGSDALTETLQAEGLSYTDVKLYDIAVDAERRRYAQERMAEVDFLTFASGSGVRGLLEAGGRLPKGVKTVCIGEVTAETLCELGYERQIVAKDYTAEGIVAAILEEQKRKE